MNIMKATAIVWTFAAVLAAQEAPRSESTLAQAIAVEEQEHDLARAERLYRELLAGAKLAAADRAATNLRLGALLQKLGRVDEAKAFLAAGGKGQVATLDDVTEQVAQDAARVAELRKQAEALVKKSQNGQVDIEKLLWIGEPAVPVVIAAIEEQARNNVMPQVSGRLAAVLFAIGGEEAEKFLLRAAQSPELNPYVVLGIPAIRHAAMWKVAEAYLLPTPFDTLRGILEVNEIAKRFDPNAVVDACAEGDNERKAWLLSHAGSLDQDRLRPEQRERFVEIARDALRCTDPQIGLAARESLQSPLLQSTRSGVALILDELTRTRGELRFDLKFWSKVDATDWRALLPNIDACAEALPREGVDLARNWITVAMDHSGIGPEQVERLVHWFELGCTPVGVLPTCLTTDNAEAVFAVFPRLPERSAARDQFLGAIAKIELPPSLWPVLRDAAAAVKDPQIALDRFGKPIANTGNPAAAEWLLARWSESPHRSDVQTNAILLLLDLFTRTQDEPVRAALRAIIANEPANSQLYARITTALVRATDEPVLALLAKKPCTAALRLLLETHDPVEHHYSEAQLEAFVAAAHTSDSSWNPAGFTSDLIGDRLLQVLATSVSYHFGENGDRRWSTVAIRRLNRANGEGPFAAWLLARLDAGRAQFDDIYGLNDEAFAAIRPQFEQRLASDDPGIVTFVAEQLLRREIAVDADALLRRANADIDEWVVEQAVEGRLLPAADLLRPLLKAKSSSTRAAAAKYLGGKVDKEAVPGLLELLRDPEENVRTAATEALTRIRFFHEQQAHWDRVLKGLDASPASAAEKLLLQAKPGAPKPQRLLAIASLGLLGVPEALPFLIEWTSDGDAEVAQKAREAIQQIHLNPRR